MSDRSRFLAATALSLGLVLPFVDKPVHVDDANFLVLARGAAQDMWRPHAIEINWQGQTQPAFDVLSNPPGIGWWLAPVHDAGVVVQHLWMLPWLLLALWGAARLGKALANDALGGMLLLGTAPVVVLGAQALTPDLPLYACALAGVGGFLTSKRPALWALLAGCAALFRYSGACLIPLLVLAGVERKKLPAALLSAVPLLALILHDVAAYGSPHIVAMMGFQSEVATTGRDVFRKLVAALAMLGGVALLPVLTVGKRGAIGGVIGALLGLGGALISSQAGLPAFATVAFAAAGGMAMSYLHVDNRDTRLLTAWAVGGLLFLLALRFTAARYWLPFIAGPILLALRRGPRPALVALAVALNCGLALALSWDDREMAQAHQRAAASLDGLEPGTFSGHWGWQHHMEAGGWTALEEDAVPGPIHASALRAWPQEAAESCRIALPDLVLYDPTRGLRVHTIDGGANLHAFVISADPPVETYAPWSIGSDPLEELRVSGACPDPALQPR